MEGKSELHKREKIVPICLVNLSSPGWSSHGKCAGVPKLKPRLEILRGDKMEWNFDFIRKPTKSEPSS